MAIKNMILGGFKMEFDVKVWIMYFRMSSFRMIGTAMDSKVGEVDLQTIWSQENQMKMEGETMQSLSWAIRMDLETIWSDSIRVKMDLETIRIRL